MIFAQNEGITLEVNAEMITIHNNQDNQLLNDYQELSIVLTKKQISDLIAILGGDK